MHQPASVNEALRSQGEAINQLFAQHYKGSLRTAYRILRSKEDSEDAVQTAYFAAFREFHGFRGESSFKTWITRIVVNRCLAQLRERARPHVSLNDIQHALPLVDSDSVTPEALCYLRELQTAHRKAASRLPQRLHDVYESCVISGIAFRKVAHRLGLTTSAAKSRLFRARKVVDSLEPVIQRRAA